MAAARLPGHFLSIVAADAIKLKACVAGAVAQKWWLLLTRYIVTATAASSGVHRLTRKEQDQEWGTGTLRVAS